MYLWSKLGWNLWSKNTIARTRWQFVFYIHHHEISIEFPPRMQYNSPGYQAHELAFTEVIYHVAHITGLNMCSDREPI